MVPVSPEEPVAYDLAADPSLRTLLGVGPAPPERTADPVPELYPSARSFPQPGPAPSLGHSTASTAGHLPGRIRIDEAFWGKFRPLRAGRVLDVAECFG